MGFVAVGAAVGTLLALLRGRVLLAILVNAFFAIVVALCGFLLGYHLGLSALVGFGFPGPGGGVSAARPHGCRIEFRRFCSRPLVVDRFAERAQDSASVVCA